MPAPDAEPDSVIVRNMSRPSLGAALASIAAQVPAMVCNLALLCQAAADTGAALAHCESALEMQSAFAPALRLRAALPGAGRRRR
jgi:hypothetical protein